MLAEDTLDGRLMYTHRLAPGVTRIMMYGLRLAQSTCLPHSVLQRAKEICDNLAENRLVEPVYCEGKTEAEEDQEYIEELLNLIQHGKFDLNEVKKVQSKLKRRYGIEDSPDHSDVIETLAVDIDRVGPDNSDGNEGVADSVNHETNDALSECNVSKPAEPADISFTSRICPSVSCPERNSLLVNAGRSNHSPKSHSTTGNMSSINMGASMKTIESHFSSTPQRGRHSASSEQASSVIFSPLNAVGQDFTPPFLSRAPISPARQSLCLGSTKSTQHLDMHAIQNSPVSTNIPHTSLRKHLLENPLVTSSRTSSLHVHKEFDRFNVQLNQRPTVRNSPEVSNHCLPLVPYSFSQSSHRHSTGTLSQNSHLSNKTVYADTSMESSCCPLPYNSPMSDTVETEHLGNSLNIPLDTGSNTSTRSMQQNRFVEEMSSAMLLEEHVEAWPGSSRDSSGFSSHSTHHLNQRYSTFETLPNSTPARFGQSSQMRSVSNTPMILNLSPNFERITRTLGSENMGYNTDDDFFEE